jgi:predicted metalloprotease with PDZ domain
MKTKTSIYHRTFAFAYVLLVAVFSSCEPRTVEYEYKQQIVKAKTIDLKDGSTRYNIAFTDGSSENFDFGLYTKYEVGDTVCWKREKNWLWYVIDCH